MADNGKAHSAHSAHSSNSHTFELIMVFALGATLGFSVLLMVGTALRLAEDVGYLKEEVSWLKKELQAQRARP